MHEDTVKDLEVFGLTSNQAKVYLSILEAGSISVGKIAEMSGLYRQDIYKIIPKLEKIGLVTRTLGTPIVVKAISVNKALRTLVENEKREALQRIELMETNLEHMCNAISSMFESEIEANTEEPHFSLLTKENEIINKGDLLYEEACKECNVVLSIELIMIRANVFRERFRKAIKNGARIRLVIEAPRKDQQIKQAIERLAPNTDDFTAKLFVTEKPKPFHIIDRKNVWIATTKQQPETGLPCILWSDGKNIVESYLERFERIWNSSKLI